MTAKELHRLRRQEVLELLLAQSEDLEQTKLSLSETSDQLEVMTANYERLRKRLDLKDAQIRELRATLSAERTKREIELEEAGNIAEAALRLNKIFEMAQKAADQYLYNVQRQTGPAQAEGTEEEHE